MKQALNRMMIGVAFLAVSGLNVYLPNVGNLFDEWRIAFSVVTFCLGWLMLIGGLLDYTD